MYFQMCYSQIKFCCFQAFETITCRSKPKENEDNEDNEDEYNNYYNYNNQQTEDDSIDKIVFIDEIILR